MSNRLDEIREREKRATPDWSEEWGFAGAVRCLFLRVGNSNDGIRFRGENENSDVHFAAHARTDIPYLLSLADTAKVIFEDMIRDETIPPLMRARAREWLSSLGAVSEGGKVNQGG